MIVNSYGNKTKGIGFGDFLRGTLACSQLCEIYNIKFDVDLRHHPVGKWLDIDYTFDKSEKSDILDLQDIGDMSLQALRDKIIFEHELYLLESNQHIYTNVFPRFPLRQKERNLIKSLLIPKKEILNSINKILHDISEYEVIHIRCGDLLSFSAQVGYEPSIYTVEELIEELTVIDQIKSNAKREVLVMSDSAEIKKAISKKYKLRQTSTRPTHSALCKDNSADTLIDFFITLNAKHIHQFSVFPWGSGFSNIANWVYDVPLTQHSFSKVNAIDANYFKLLIVNGGSVDELS